MKEKWSLVKKSKKIQKYRFAGASIIFILMWLTHSQRENWEWLALGVGFMVFIFAESRINQRLERNISEIHNELLAFPISEVEVEEYRILKKNGQFPYVIMHFRDGVLVKRNVQLILDDEKRGIFESTEVPEGVFTEHDKMRFGVHSVLYISTKEAEKLDQSIVF